MNVYADYHAATVAFAMLGKLFISVTFSCIYVYSSELFPTEVRNVGLGTASMCARISSMASSYVGGPLVSAKLHSTNMLTTCWQLGNTGVKAWRVGWQVTLCDPIRQVTLRSSVMDFSIKSYTFLYLFYHQRTRRQQVVDAVQHVRTRLNCCTKSC